MIGTLDETRREATVVGAGIAGMLAAYSLDRKGYEVTLLEESGRAGGLIQTVRTEYGMAERAAHSLLASGPVVEFCRELGVELAEVRRDSRARFIVRSGKLRKFPLGVGEAVGALGRAAFARARADEHDLDSWGRTHLGGAAVDYLLTPFVRGIYGIQPAELGVDAAFPMLSVPPGQTLLGSALRKALKRHPKNGDGMKAPNGGAGKGRRESKRMVAPRYGMDDLTSRLEKRLEERLGGRFRRGVRVEEIPDAPNVLLATPAYAASRLLQSSAPELGRALAGVRYTPIVSVTAFVPVESLTRPVKGVGALVPAKEGRKSLGILFTSSSFEGRVNDESRYVSFAVLLGGSSQPHWATATDAEIEEAVCGELEALLGVRGEAARLVISRWAHAIPQYSVTLPAVWRLARETWCATPGHLLCGNYTGQVSLRGMIEEAARLG
ncbi:MAG TPA: protoporphyrinogen oxidase [Pyrinomonadaceae bacterium]|jgi:oxygen-dependent protoporphyrinogen oxidase|nr:protoporphyrinogen oxidase [Pyrinomonadaceae bacterium]